VENSSTGSQVVWQAGLAIRLRTSQLRVILQEVQFPAQAAHLQINAQVASALFCFGNAK